MVNGDHWKFMGKNHTEPRMGLKQTQQNVLYNEACVSMKCYITSIDNMILEYIRITIYSI